MSPLGVAVVVLGILLLVTAVNLVVWLPIVKKLQRMPAEMLHDLEGETIVRAPERGAYRGATAVYGVVKGIGIAVLTDKRLVFRKAAGNEVSVPRAEIIGVRTAKWFLSSRAGGQEHVIVKLASGAEVGFFFADRAAWVAALSPASAPARS